MELYFEIGGSRIRVTAPRGTVRITGSQLEAFCIPPQRTQFTLELNFVEQLPQPEGEILFRDPERRVYAQEGGYLTVIGGESAPCLWVQRRGNHSRVLASLQIYELPIRAHALLRAMEAEHLIAAGGGFLLHSSFISYEGRAILFTAPSGTGKSTQAELWRTLRGAQVLNGDRCVVRRGEAGFEAWGVPFSGSSGICHNASMPLGAIVVLSQGEETTITPLSGVRAFRALWEGCSLHTWNREEVAKSSELVSEAIAQVPIYHLSCTPDESAVTALEAMLNKQRRPYAEE